MFRTLRKRRPANLTSRTAGYFNDRLDGAGDILHRARGASILDSPAPSRMPVIPVVFVALLPRHRREGTRRQQQRRHGERVNENPSHAGPYCSLGRPDCDAAHTMPHLMRRARFSRPAILRASLPPLAARLILDPVEQILPHLDRPRGRLSGGSAAEQGETLFKQGDALTE